MIKFKNILKENYPNIDIKALSSRDWVIDLAYQDPLDMVSYYRESNDVSDDIEDEEIEEMPEFREWLASFIYQDMLEFDNNVPVDGNTITIWREMTVSEDYFKTLLTKNRHLGKYWSWDEDAAEAHWGYTNDKKKIKILFEAEVNIKYVNWSHTYVVNSLPYQRDEREIRLKRNVPIKLLNIYVNDVEVNFIDSSKDQLTFNFYKNSNIYNIDKKVLDNTFKA